MSPTDLQLGSCGLKIQNKPERSHVLPISLLREKQAWRHFRQHSASWAAGFVLSLAVGTLVPGVKVGSVLQPWAHCLELEAPFWESGGLSSPNLSNTLHLSSALKHHRQGEWQGGMTRPNGWQSAPLCWLWGVPSPNSQESVMGVESVEPTERDGGTGRSGSGVQACLWSPGPSTTCSGHLRRVVGSCLPLGS